MLKAFIISLFITIATTVAAGIAINSADSEVPIHWNAAGEVDGYGSPWTLIIFPIISLLTTLLLFFFPKIDPQSDNIRKSGPLLGIMMIAIAALMFGITIVLITAINGGGILHLPALLALGLGLIFIAMGFHLPKVKHNYMLGIRTPWTLHDEKIWQKTHQASKYWLISAGVLFIGTIFFNNPLALIVPVAYVILVMSGLAVYSYRLFAKEKKKESK